MKSVLSSDIYPINTRKKLIKILCCSVENLDNAIILLEALPHLALHLMADLKETAS